MSHIAHHVYILFNFYFHWWNFMYSVNAHFILFFKFNSFRMRGSDSELCWPPRRKIISRVFSYSTSQKINVHYNSISTFKTLNIHSHKALGCLIVELEILFNNNNQEDKQNASMHTTDWAEVLPFLLMPFS